MTVRKCLHFPPHCSHKALRVDKCDRKCQTSECLQSFLLRTNRVYKFLHSSSAELARNSVLFMFRAALSCQQLGSSQTSSQASAEDSSGISQDGNNRGGRIRWRFMFGLDYLGWKSEEKNQRWMQTVTCLYRSLKDGGACGFN